LGDEISGPYGVWKVISTENDSVCDRHPLKPQSLVQQEPQQLERRGPRVRLYVLGVKGCERTYASAASVRARRRTRRNRNGVSDELRLQGCTRSREEHAWAEKEDKVLVRACD
jgi:hypothetical protein